MEHIVYADKKSKVLEKMLAGSKTLIVRGAAGRKLPYGRVFAGETLYFVENDGSRLLRAKAKVKAVTNTEKMEHEASVALIESLQDQLDLSPAQFKRWAGKKMFCLVEVENVEEIPELSLNRQKNMDDWITVESISAITGDIADNKAYESVRVK